MGQVIDLKAKGLYTHPNQLGSVPQGALTEAKNVVIDKDDVIETKRGSKPHITSLTSAPKQLMSYKDRILVHFGSTIAYDSDGDGTDVDYNGTYDAISNRRMRYIRSNQNLYFTTDDGVYRLTTLAGTPTLAGGIKALDGSASLTGTSGFMATDTQVAYRIVWGLKDANDNLILGAPSSRITIANSSGGTRDVDLTFIIPDDVTTDYFYQIYRSGESASASSEANDELQLVIEAHPSAGEITAQEVTVTDNVPNALRGASLYTNPSQQGIANANDIPPVAKDVTVFRNHALYANTKTKQRLFVDLIAVGTGNLDIDDTVTVGGETFTGKAAEDAASNEFLIETGGTVSFNIAETAKSLIRVVNQSTATVYGYYISNFDDLPGKMLFESKAFTDTEFTASSNVPDAFNPTLTSESSTNEEKVNRFYIAKPFQPDAVPILNYIDVGSQDDEILRIIALRDSCFILKEDGIFRLTGTDIGNFSVSLFDNTAIQRGVDTADTLNNQIFCYSTQGVISVSDNGVQVLSRPIEEDLLEVSSDAFSSFDTIAFGVGYESERKYILYVPTLDTDTYATQAFVYNTFTSSWTQWVENRTCAIINPGDDKLYTGQGDANNVRQERKTYTINDYTENEYAVTISSYSSTVVTLADASNAAIGQTLAQENDDGVVIRQAKITAVDSNDVTVDREVIWETSAAGVLFDPIDVRLQWAPIHGGNPGVVKHFPEVTMFFRDAQFKSIDISFSSNFTDSDIDTPLLPVVNGAFGYGQFGQVPWGGGPPAVQPIRTYIPLEQQRAHWLNMTIEHNEAATKMGISGFSFILYLDSERFV